MKYHEIHDSLKDHPTWHESPFDARAKFVEEMAGRQYGREPLSSAWEWFVVGWNGALDS